MFLEINCLGKYDLIKNIQWLKNLYMRIKYLNLT